MLKPKQHPAPAVPTSTPPAAPGHDTAINPPPHAPQHTPVPLLRLNTRQLKVYRNYRFSELSVPSYRPVPEIRLNGDWLARAGFATGRQISVTVLHRQLIIRQLA
jgi:hypothetical protein